MSYIVPDNQAIGCFNKLMRNGNYTQSDLNMCYGNKECDILYVGNSHYHPIPKTELRHNTDATYNQLMAMECSSDGSQYYVEKRVNKSGVGCNEVSIDVRNRLPTIVTPVVSYGELRRR